MSVAKIGILILKTACINPNSFISNTPTVELSCFQFNDQDILKIIRVLHVNKGHGCDDILICMSKICDQSIIKPLSIIYQNCLNTDTFPDIWKKSNIVPVHKKGDTQVVNNCRLVSLLPVCGNILERLVFNSIFNFLDNNSLLICKPIRFQSQMKAKFCQFVMKYMPLLIVIQLWRLGVYF